MGTLYKALTRNQNLQPLTDAIRGVVEEKQRQDNLKQLYQLQQNLPNQLNQAVQERTVPTDNMGINYNTPTPQLAAGTRPNVFDLRNNIPSANQDTQGNNATGSIGNLSASLASNKINPNPNTNPGAYPAITAKVLGGNQPNIYQSVPGATAPTEQAFTRTIPLSNREQKQNLYDAAAKYLTEVYGLQSLSPEQKQGAANILNMQLTSRMPEAPVIKELGKDRKLISMDSEGNIKELASNLIPQTQKEPSHIVGKDGYYYYYNPKTGLHDIKSNVQAPANEWQFTPKEPKEPSYTFMSGPDGEIFVGNNRSGGIRDTGVNKGVDNRRTEERAATLIGNIETNLSQMQTEQDEGKRKKIFSDIKGDTEELAQRRGLRDAVHNYAWPLIKKGNDPETVISAMDIQKKNKTGQGLSKDEKATLRLYFKARKF